MVPVVDMFAEDDELRARNRLGLVHLADEFVDGRAAGAAFRSEEFEEDGDGLIGWGGLIGGEGWGDGQGDADQQG